MPSVILRKTLAAAVLTGSLFALPMTSFAAENPKPVASQKAAKSPAGKMHHKVRVSATVKQVQEALNRTGAKLTVDGVLGHKTRLALKSFQKAHKLKATGRLDKATRKALLKG